MTSDGKAATRAAGSSGANDEARRGRVAAGAEPVPVAAVVRVALADKNPLSLEAERALFEADRRFLVVVTATDGERFLDAVKLVPFDVGVIGWLMPFADGPVVLDRLRARSGAPRIVVYTGSPDPDVARTAMALGASGFCAKSDPPSALVEIVLAVAHGRMVFPIIDLRTLHDDPFAHLTKRERELLGALPRGLSNAQLAKEFAVSVNTIKFHLKSLYDKLGARNRAQATAMQVGRHRL